MKKIRQYDGLYGDLEYRPHAEYIFLEKIETRSQEFGWIIQPHIHAHLCQVFFVESGKVVFQDSILNQSLKTPCIIWVPPASLHGLTYSEDVKGKILTMSDDVAESLLPEGGMLLGFFSSLKVIDVTKQNLPSFRAILDLVKKCEDELFSEKPEKKLMILSLFQQLFILIFRLQEQQEKYFHFQDPRSLKYFQQFQKIVTSSEYPKSIPTFARDLGISSVHLNRVCQAVSGKPASLIIQEYLVKKAQHYLNHTSYSVSEIAYMLRFAYPNYFARLFKKHTGISPKEYREMGRGNFPAKVK